MERHKPKQANIKDFFSKKTTSNASSSSGSKRSHDSIEDVELHPTQEDAGDVQTVPRRDDVEIDLDNLPSDPGLRLRISEYHPNVQEQVRRSYLLKGPCQPIDHNFPVTVRNFIGNWFSEFPGWLEYSIAKDAVFCLYFYLFKPIIGAQGGGDAFVQSGFSSWNKKDRLRVHVGGVNSAHNKAYRKCQSLLNQNQHLETFFDKQSTQARSDYRTRLTAIVECIRFLLRQGLAFRGHDESEESSNQGNFLELLCFLANHNDDIKKVVLSNAPGNLKLTSPLVQKNVVNASETETTNVILKDLGNSLFSVLIDESRDISIKEQMAVVIRYVDMSGSVIERFIGIVHVSDTTALSLKQAIDALFSKHSLSISSLRGQGYDGASNIKGEINGLKTLILKENPSAFYVHCFSHQLQLALVSVAKKEEEMASLFSLILVIANVAGASCKRRDKLREKQDVRVAEALDTGELTSVKGLNQEYAMKRPGDTRWSSHYEALLNLIIIFPSVIEVIDDITEDALSSEQRGEASGLLKLITTFDFIFKLFFMKNILGITNSLSKALQRKDQDIDNAMSLVGNAKSQLQEMRDNGWDSLLAEISSICSKHDIMIPHMEDAFVPWKRSQRKDGISTYLHYYRVYLFIRVMDWQAPELNDRFDEVSTELLLCLASHSPNNSFSSFDSSKLIRLAEFYPNDFSRKDLMVLRDELRTYISDMLSSDTFSDVDGISGLAKKMVKTKKHQVYPLVYKLLTLALLLPVATTTVERAFSSMQILKNRLRNKMGDEWMNDCMVTYIEKDVFDSVDTEVVIQRYQNMTNHREQL